MPAEIPFSSVLIRLALTIEDRERVFEERRADLTSTIAHYQLGAWTRALCNTNTQLLTVSRRRRCHSLDLAVEPRLQGLLGFASQWRL